VVLQIDSGHYATRPSSLLEVNSLDTNPDQRLAAIAAGSDEMDGRLSRRNSSDHYALEYRTSGSPKVFAADDVQSPTSRKHRQKWATRQHAFVVPTLRKSRRVGQPLRVVSGMGQPAYTL
jgi:hypothetical protein